jgi:hypothetical protein
MRCGRGALNHWRNFILGFISNDQGFSSSRDRVGLKLRAVVVQLECTTALKRDPERSPCQNVDGSNKSAQLVQDARRLPR